MYYIKFTMFTHRDSVYAESLPPSIELKGTLILLVEVFSTVEHTLRSVRV